MEGFSEKPISDLILRNPEKYIGSAKSVTQRLWVLEDNAMVNRSVTYIPGILKIFEAILLNAAEHKRRDSSLDLIEVVINVKNTLITISNNGVGVPVLIIPENNRYLPEAVFSKLGSTYLCEDRKEGWGAKLANIFSTSFIIDIADGKKRYRQEFKSNMKEKFDPLVEDCESTHNWTKISFKPDLKKFGTGTEELLDSDTIALMRKRVLEIAACLGDSVQVNLDGQTVQVRSFEDYVKFYPGDNESRLSFKFENNRGEVIVTRLSDGDFQQASFVNSIATVKGGTHVDLVTNQITEYITKTTKWTVKPDDVKRHMFVFCNAVIANPGFDCGMRQEKLTVSQSEFGSDYKLSDHFLENVMKMLGVGKTKVDSKGFDDAMEAGGEKAHLCTLILTEGLSAARFVRKALDVFSEDKRRCYGVFALQGKLTNVKKASKRKEENELLKRLKIAIRQNGKQRYGKVMIMTDQDVDGFHIKGLLINFFHTVWPDLVKREEAPFFIGEFVTPMYKATNELKQQVLSFYSKVEYDQWYEQGNRAGWAIQRYKGIASGRDEEAQEYFQNFDTHYRDFVWKDDDEAAIQAAFSRKKVGERKDWIDKFVRTSYLDRKNKKTTQYSDFINQELILFALESVERTMPMMVDGLIPSQRKTLFCALGRKVNKEYKVTDLAGRVSHKSDYRHGQRSIVKVIIKMAQDYVGASNINLLNQIGQFGTRRFHGQDAATATYISTKISPLARFIFPEDDDIVLDYQKDHNGKTIEPISYMPIIPLILVNGCNGIGYSFSTFVPNFNTKTIIKNIRLKLDKKSELEAMEPSYIGFQGNIEKVSDGVYSTTGVYEELDNTTIKISELPINPKPKITVESLKKTVEGGKLLVLDVEDRSTSFQFDYRVKMTTNIMEIADINKTFRLKSTIRYSNMVLLDENRETKRYKTPREIFDAFFEARSKAYERRHGLIWDMMRNKLDKLKQMDRYVSLLKERKFETGMPKSDWEDVLKKEGLEELEDANGIISYNYLIDYTSGWTEQKCIELKDKISTLEKDVEEYERKNPEDLWREDLDRLEEAMEKLNEPENPRKRKQRETK